jgi:cytochrome b subunit of formate dehydrogenase
VTRLDWQQLTQHQLLAVSFIVLVITGFALCFPEASWVEPLHWTGMSECVRSTVRRVAAVILMGVGTRRTFYVVANRRGRRKFSALMPRLEDVTNLFTTLRFHLGIRRRHPHFGPYDYTQKAEYWTLVWGTVVMAAGVSSCGFPRKP